MKFSKDVKLLNQKNFFQKVSQKGKKGFHGREIRDNEPRKLCG